MSLSQIVHKFIEKEKLFLRDDRLLCAVSGGMDSMALVDILRNLGYMIAVAHVNYMLRGSDSLADQALVSDYCTTHKIPFYTKTVTAEESSSLKEGNLQEKARSIRDKWFQELLDTHDYDYLCLGHHQEDHAETFLYHALRGSGMRGLRSIQSVSGLKRRPLFSSSKGDIGKYVREFNVPYRNDHTNSLSDYDRNYLRNQVFPILHKRWPEGVSSLSQSARHISADYNLLMALVTKERQNWMVKKNAVTAFGPIDQFVRTENASNLAYHLLYPYGFNKTNITQMLFDRHQSGILFYSDTHEAVFDRNYILIQDRKSALKVDTYLPHPGDVPLSTGQLSIEVVEYIQLSDDPHIQFIDASSIQWPLHLRTWKSGDVITPLGMSGQHKKVSDILIDRKLSILSKRNQLVLADHDGHIIWLIGQQLSEHCKLKKETKEYFKITWQPGH